MNGPRESRFEARLVGFVRDEEAQASFLLVAIFFVFVGLFGYVVNAGLLVHAKVETQCAADAAAYGAAMDTARTLNFVSNCNIGVLEITAVLAMMDAIDGTVDDSEARLDMWEGIGQGMLGSIFPATVVAGQIILAKVRLERIYLGVFEVMARAKAMLRPVYEVTRQIVAQTARIAMAALLPHMLRGPNRVWSDEIEVQYARLPQEIPTNKTRMNRYEDKGKDLLRKYARSARRYLARMMHLAGSAGHWDRHTRQEFEQLIAKPPDVLELERRPSDIDKDWADEKFRFVFEARHRRLARPRWTMPGIYGADSAKQPTDVAESMVFNPVRWDLITPQWDACLVPVENYNPFMTGNVDAATMATYGQIMH